MLRILPSFWVWTYRRPASPPLTKGSSEEERALRFQALLRENQDQRTAEYVESLLKIWTRLGGTLSYGTGTDTSCFPLVWDKASVSGHNLWPVAFYPLSGTVEVVFQYLSSRPPFDALDLRRELLTRSTPSTAFSSPRSSLVCGRRSRWTCW